jgi:hypothetical protein
VSGTSLLATPIPPFYFFLTTFQGKAAQCLESLLVLQNRKNKLRVSYETFSVLDNCKSYDITARGVDLLLYWCSMMQLIDSSSDCSRSWFVSFASRNEGEDMELKSCIILEHVGALKPSR